MAHPAPVTDAHETHADSADGHDERALEREEVAVEVDEEDLKEDAEPPVLEVDALEKSAAWDEEELSATTGAEQDESQDGAQEEEKKRSGLRTGILALVLFVLLAASAALNIEQARQGNALADVNDRLDAQLTQTTAFAASEGARADAAEGALETVHTAMDTVHERIGSLQTALDDLAAATTR